MSKASDTQGMLRQNLFDAGCGGDMIRQCMDLAGQQKWDKTFPKSAKIDHRKVTFHNRSQRLLYEAEAGHSR